MLPSLPRWVTDVEGDADDEGVCRALTLLSLLTVLVITGAASASAAPTAGARDTTFATGTGFAGNTVYQTVQDSSGRYVVVGDFTSYDGTPANRIARLLPTGALDTTFVQGIGFDDTVTSVVVDASGALTVVGSFTSYNGTAVNRIARLLPTGALDPAFVVGSGLDAVADDVALAGTDVVVVGGFTQYKGTTVGRIVRIDSTGTAVPAFLTGSGTGFSSRAGSVEVDGVGRILVGGSMTQYNGTTVANLARLSATGVLDGSFPAAGNPDAQVTALHVDPQDGVHIGGFFTQVGSTAAGHIAHLTSTGALDPAFATGAGFDGAVVSIAAEPDGSLLLGGLFSSYRGTPSSQLARLSPTGVLDNALAGAVGAGTGGPPVTSVLVESSGRAVVAGAFTSFQGSPAGRIARLAASAPTPTPTPVPTPVTGPTPVAAPPAPSGAGTGAELAATGVDLRGLGLGAGLLAAGAAALVLARRRA